VGIVLVDSPGWPLLACASLFGGLSFALYTLCVAHANDRQPAEQRVSASGSLVLAYSAGAAAGPLAAAAVMTLAGAAGLFGFIALCACGALLFGLWRQATASPVPAAEQQNYQILPRTTPMAAGLDPVSADDQQETL
jgi:MFS family permease